MTATVHQFPQTQDSVLDHNDESVVRSLRWRLTTGLIVVFVLVFGVVGWAATAQLSGAVIAPGNIVVDGNIKKVQHPTGGIVGEIYVKNGSSVKVGDILMRLDDTQTRASLGIVTSQLTELVARRARLAAIRDGAKSISFPTGFKKHTAKVGHVMMGEQQLFASTRAMIESQKAQLQERIGQLRDEIKGFAAQKEAKARELSLVRQELVRVEGLYQRNLTPVTRVLSIKRDEARIAGEHGAFTSQIAQARGRIVETRMQITGLIRTTQNEAQKELREIEARIAELEERKVAAEDQLKRVEIRAPRSGLVHELNVHTIGGVINAAEPIMLVVPSEDRLTVEVRVNPPDIDQVTVGQEAVLRLSAFNQRTTPELSGTVARVSADLSRDVQTGQSFYNARIEPSETASNKLKKLKLIPGMPVEAFIQTDKRTALSYVLKPLTDHLARTFREE